MVERKRIYEDEEELLHRVSLGDTEAFTTVYYRYKDKLYGFVLGLTRSTDKSEDIVQDVFLKLWQNREQASEIDNLNAYLFRMAQNQFVDALRKFSKSIAIISEYKKNKTENITPIDTLIGKELNEKIEEAIHSLSPRQRKVYCMHKEQGLPHAEIASLLNLSLSTIQNHINRAFANIRKYLAHSYPGVNSP